MWLHAVLCVDCHIDPNRKEEEKRLHFARVQKLAEKSPNQKRYREKLIKKNKKKFIPGSLMGSSVLRNEYLNDINGKNKPQRNSSK